MQRESVVPIEADQEFGRESGPRACHRSGPYQLTTLRSSSIRWFRWDSIPKEHDVDLLMIIAAICLGLASLGAFAATVGADSRDGIGDDRLPRASI
jgi:hypothetical protein